MHRWHDKYIDSLSENMAWIATMFGQMGANFPIKWKTNDIKNVQQPQKSLTILYGLHYKIIILRKIVPNGKYVYVESLWQFSGSLGSNTSLFRVLCTRSGACHWLWMPCVVIDSNRWCPKNVINWNLRIGFLPYVSTIPIFPWPQKFFPCSHFFYNRGRYLSTSFGLYPSSKWGRKRAEEQKNWKAKELQSRENVKRISSNENEPSEKCDSLTTNKTEKITLLAESCRRQAEHKHHPNTRAQNPI